MNKHLSILFICGLIVTVSFSSQVISYTSESSFLTPQSEANINYYLGNLTSFPNRFSGSAGENQTADYIFSSINALNLSVTKEYFSSSYGTLTNIVVTIPGSPSSDEIIVLGAHYDTVNITPAPGADDNGASVAVLMELCNMLKNQTLYRTVKIIFFSGEEVGRLGSLNWVTTHEEDLDKILVVMILDMIAWGDHVVFDYNQPSRWAADYLNERINPLSGEFETISESYISDQTRFWDAGVSALLIHHNNPLDYPYYHTSNDTIDKLNMSVTYMTARLVFDATVLFANDTSLTAARQKTQFNPVILIVPILIFLAVIVYISFRFSKRDENAYRVNNRGLRSEWRGRYICGYTCF